MWNLLHFLLYKQTWLGITNTSVKWFINAIVHVIYVNILYFSDMFGGKKVWMFGQKTTHFL